MKEVDLSGANWRVSSYSGNGASCVAVAHVDECTATRDSKNPAGPALVFAPNTWHDFIGEFKRM